MSEELKACPWCGSKAEEDEFFSDGIAVRAVSCSGDNDHCDYGYLLKDWQSRPIEDALRARIAELEKELALLKVEHFAERSALNHTIYAMEQHDPALLAAREYAEELQDENIRLREEVERLSRQTGDK